jgi:hypothetical protein
MSNDIPEAQNTKQKDELKKDEHKEIESKLIHTSLLAPKEVNKRERLVQTYIVLFGLLLSYAQIDSLQKNTMDFFLAFMILIMMYYSALTSYWFMLVVALVYRVSCSFFRKLLSILKDTIFIPRIIFIPIFSALAEPLISIASMVVIRLFYLLFLNFFAILSSLCLSYVVVIYFQYLSNGQTNLKLPVLIFLTILLSLPLSIRKDMLNNKIIQ